MNRIRTICVKRRIEKIEEKQNRKNKAINQIRQEADPKRIYSDRHVSL